MTLRDARAHDLEAINAIYNYYVEHSTCTYQETPESIEGRREWFARHGSLHPVIVAEIDGRVAGWGSLSAYHSRCAYRYTVEDSVYVAQPFQGRGIGSAILGNLIERGRVIGHHAVIAAIDADQPASIALHARFGFELVGRFHQVGFKFDRWLDVAYMELLLAGTATH